jgi:hypothetical protein
VHFNVPAQALDVGFDQVQPHAPAGVVGVKPLVEFEDVGPGSLLVKARAVVGHFDNLGPGRVPGRAHVHAQGPPVGAVLEGVGQEVEEDAVQEGAVGVDAEVLGNLHVDGAARLPQQLVQAFHDLLHHLGQGHGLGRVPVPLFPDGEDGVHVAQHLVELLQVGLQVGVGFLKMRRPRFFGAQQVGQPQGVGQRGAQVVRRCR